LWAGCVGVMLYFRESVAMEAAYGFFILMAMLMTTTLLFGWLRYVRHWPLAAVLATMSVFFAIEIAYFVANTMKFTQAAWFSLVVVVIFGVMSVWFRGRKITNRYLDVVPLASYANSLRELSNDKEVPKFATHLVYLTKADAPGDIEHRTIASIMARKVKR